MKELKRVNQNKTILDLAKENLSKRNSFRDCQLKRSLSTIRRDNMRHLKMVKHF